MQLVRGTRDLLFEEYPLFREVVEAARLKAGAYGFQEISTPILEMASLFKHTSGEASDIVSKEMFEVASRGAEKEEAQTMVLRPEGTAPFMRAMLNNGLHQQLPVKAFYQGPMFRYDRPQKGRLRQFHQVGVEWVGDATPWADVDVMACAADYLKALGLLEAVTLQINTLGDSQSREHHRQSLVAYFQGHAQDLSPESLKRLATNPLRILDSKHPADQEIAREAPRILDYLTPASQTFFEAVKAGLKALDIPYEVEPSLVRGLDYYSHTAFEFTTPELGAQQTVLAGGRYDGLSQLLGGLPLPGVGWAAGVERLILLKAQVAPFKAQVPSLRISVLPMDEADAPQALALAHQLRGAGYWTEILWGTSQLGKKLKKVDKQGFTHALILGEEERGQQAITMKNLTTGLQTLISLDGLVAYTNSLLK
ncbi:MAG: histidine--tRNA ligase [Alphaproteobacteria bacterium]